MPLQYAAPWKRVAAFLFDLALTAPLAVFVTPLAWLGCGAALAAICQGSGWQRTPGKALFGMKLMEANGRRTGWLRAAARALLQYWAVHQAVVFITKPYRMPVILQQNLESLPPIAEWEAPRVAWAWIPMLLALLMLLVDRRGRTWWDRVCGTSVISLPPTQVKLEG